MFKIKTIIFFCIYLVVCACGVDVTDPKAGYFDDDVDRSVDQSIKDDHSQNNTTIYNIDESQHNDNSTTITTIVDSVIVIRDTIKYNTLDTVHVIIKDTIKHTKIDTTYKTIYDTIHVLNTDTLYRTILDTIHRTVTVKDTVHKTIIDTNVVRVEVIDVDTIAPTLTSNSSTGSIEFGMQKSNVSGYKHLLIRDKDDDFGTEIMLTYKTNIRTYTIRHTLSTAWLSTDIETTEDCITITEIHLISFPSNVEYESYKGAKIVCIG